MIEFQIVTDNDLLKARLFNRARLSENGCWIWTGSRDGGGYGMVNRANKTLRAHRVSFEAYKGAIPAGQVVRHSCDDPACINPEHLSLGTMKDNARDRMDRGRSADLKGIEIGTAKLTEAQVLEIKKSTAPLDSLAEQYGIDRSNVWQIRSGKSWKHLNAAVGL